MDKELFTVRDNHKIAKEVFQMTLMGGTTAITRPGQFVNIALDGFYLRRPISVCDVSGDELTIIYKIVGGGTEKMSTLAAGVKLDMLTGLGNGFDVTKAGSRPLVIGGGVGVPPMYWLTKKLIERGASPVAVLGFNTADDVFYTEEFASLGAEVRLTTVDGSTGLRGFVTDAIGDSNYTYFYACGPEAMLKAVYGKTGTSGQLSFEERMACGFGACMGCSCETKYGSKRICRDGPVLEKEEILW